MLDALTLDQLRVLIVVAEEGSFSAAARKLRRVQSAISQTIGNLEAQLGLVLWDRSTKVPTLTEQGRVILSAAQRVSAEVAALRKLAGSLVSGLEPSVSLCLDALFPLPAAIELCREFAQAFPQVELRVDTQIMSAVSAKVLRGDASIGVVSPMGLVGTTGLKLSRRVLAPIRMLPVVAAEHPLAKVRGKLAVEILSAHVQIVLSERHPDESQGVPDQGVLSSRTWRVSDLHTKHELLRAGLGWGNLPEHLIGPDLRSRKLVRIHPASWGEDEHKLYLSAIHRPELVLGPAHEWVLQRLAALCQALDSQSPKQSPKQRPLRKHS